MELFPVSPFVKMKKNNFVMAIWLKFVLFIILFICIRECCKVIQGGKCFIIHLWLINIPLNFLLNFFCAIIMPVFCQSEKKVTNHVLQNETFLLCFCIGKHIENKMVNLLPFLCIFFYILTSIGISCNLILMLNWILMLKWNSHMHLHLRKFSSLLYTDQQSLLSIYHCACFMFLPGITWMTVSVLMCLCATILRV